MMNDLPSPQDVRIMPSIFADDYAAWKTGKNIKQSCRNVQSHLDQITKRTETWGFKLNSDKSVAVLFTYNEKLQNSITLQINGEKMKTETEVKFLGVVYDGLRPKAHMETPHNESRRKN